MMLPPFLRVCLPIIWFCFHLSGLCCVLEDAFFLLKYRFKYGHLSCLGSGGSHRNVPYSRPCDLYKASFSLFGVLNNHFVDTRSLGNKILFLGFVKYCSLEDEECTVDIVAYQEPPYFKHTVDTDEKVVNPV